MQVRGELRGKLKKMRKVISFNLSSIWAVLAATRLLTTPRKFYKPVSGMDIYVDGASHLMPSKTNLKDIIL